MKKTISIISIIIGVFFIIKVTVPMIIAAILRIQVPDAASIGIIGGADGPTSIVIAGHIGSGYVVIEVLAAILLIGVGIWGHRKNSKS